MKQAILLRMDLKMGKGKLVAQGSHASIAAYLKASRYARAKWTMEGMKKIVLKVKGEKGIKNLYRKARRLKLPCEIIIDRGLTQVSPGTITALGIGPANDSEIDKITGQLKLL